MTSKEKQVRNSLIYFVPLAVNSLFPLVIITVFTRILTKEDFGIWGLALVYAIFANGLANLGMQTAYERNFFEYRHDLLKSSQLLYSTLSFVFTNFFIIAVLTYIFRIQLSRILTGSENNDIIIFFALCGHFSQSILSFYLTYYKNSERAFEYATSVVFFSLLNLFFSLFFVVWIHVGVIGLIYAQLLAGIIVFFVLSLKMIKTLRLAFDLAILRESLSIAYPLTPRVFLGVISSQFDKYMIGLLASVGGVGIYSIGQKMASASFSIMTAVQNVFSPQVYQRMFEHGQNGGDLVGRYLTPFAYVCVAPALLTALFSEEAFSILTPAAFHDAVDIVIVLAMFYAIMFFGKQPQLVYAKKTFMTSWLSLLSVSMNIGLNIPFILKWGAIGAAWATLLAGLVSGLIGFVISQHYYFIRWEYKKVGVTYLIFFGAAFSILLLRQSDIPYELRLSVKIGFLVAYTAIGIHLNIITMDNLRMVRNLIPLGSRNGV